MNIWTALLAFAVIAIPMTNQILQSLVAMTKLSEVLSSRSQNSKVTLQATSNVQDCLDIPRFSKLGIWFALLSAVLVAVIFARGMALSVWGLAAVIACAVAIPILVVTPYVIYVSKSLSFITAMADRHAAVTEGLVETLSEKELKARAGPLS